MHWLPLGAFCAFTLPFCVSNDGGGLSSDIWHGHLLLKVLFLESVCKLILYWHMASTFLLFCSPHHLSHCPPWNWMLTGNQHRSAHFASWYMCQGKNGQAALCLSINNVSNCFHANSTLFLNRTVCFHLEMWRPSENLCLIN